ncbi:MAG: adenylate/guanylate cyclase domain-containing protein [Nevskiales bacterium]
MENEIADAVVALIAMGMGLAFFLADRKAPTSRALALFLAALGLAIASTVVFDTRYTPKTLPQWAPVLDSVFVTTAFIAGFEWGLRVSRTVLATDSQRALGTGLVRTAQALVVVFLILSLLFPDLHAQKFEGGAAGADLSHPGFYLFATPLALAALLIVTATVLLVRQRPDRSEGARLVSLTCAMPFLAAGLVLPDLWVPVSMALGEVIFLIGAIQYHVMQGERGQFLSRFTSPQVAQMVRERGLKNAMRTDRLQLSVVCCDIRGFTAYARAVSPDRVIQVLREYYREVGEVVARFDGTIKDQAGDGILILVGAPIPYADHARRAVEMARIIRDRVRVILARHGDQQLRLGIGIGVASGEVAVGVIGEASRLEYTAVGSAVNLASRLCGEAADGEIRIDYRTIELSGEAEQVRAMEPLLLKGFAQPVPNYVM